MQLKKKLKIIIFFNIFCYNLNYNVLILMYKCLFFIQILFIYELEYVRNVEIGFFLVNNKYGYNKIVNRQMIILNLS